MNQLVAFIAGTVFLAFTPTSILAAPAPATVAPTANRYSTGETTLATLAADPAAKAVIEKHFPGMVTEDIVAMAGTMTLKSMQQFKPELFTDAVLGQMDEEFAKLPVK